jgi:hypothetical protein
VARRRGRIINITSQAGAHRWPLVSGYSVSKAAVTKLTENLAQETKRYGITVFSVHPGLLPVGMSETVVALEPTTPHEEHVREWTLNELRQGRGAQPEQAVELFLRLAAGHGDSLSGRHLSVHDDLDAVLARMPEVRDHDLYVLRPDRLSTASPDDQAGSSFLSHNFSEDPKSAPHATQPGAVCGYYLGRPAAVWQSALRRQQKGGR